MCSMGGASHGVTVAYLILVAVAHNTASSHLNIGSCSVCVWHAEARIRDAALTVCGEARVLAQRSDARVAQVDRQLRGGQCFEHLLRRGLWIGLDIGRVFWAPDLKLVLWAGRDEKPKGRVKRDANHVHRLKNARQNVTRTWLIAPCNLMWFKADVIQSNIWTSPMGLCRPHTLQILCISCTLRGSPSTALTPHPVPVHLLSTNKTICFRKQIVLLP